MSAALKRRLSDLEKQSAAKAVPKFGWTCIPLWFDPHFSLEEISPGIWRDTNAWGYGKRSVMYSSREQLDVWLALPEQVNKRHTIYHIVTAEECAKVLADIESSC